MIVGCYTLNLYCDRSGYSDPPGNSCPRDRGLSPIGEFIGPNRTRAIAEAQREGWLVKDAEDVCLCPQCRRDAALDSASGRETAPAGTGDPDRVKGLRKAAKVAPHRCPAGVAITGDPCPVCGATEDDFCRRDPTDPRNHRAALDGASGQGTTP